MDCFHPAAGSPLNHHPFLGAMFDMVFLIGAIAVVLGVPAALFGLLSVFSLPAEDPTDSSRIVGAVFVVVAAAALIVVHVGADRALRHVVERRPLVMTKAVTISRVAVVAVVAVVAWWARPVFHGVVMLLYVYPLVTWIPLLVGFAVVAVCVLGAVAARREARAGLRFGLAWQTFAAVVSWIVFMALLPSWQGQALYAASSYIDTTSLPLTTQPRLLPKVAARDRGDLRDAHLVVDPSSGQLAWSAEHKGGFILRGSSDGVVVQPLDRVDASVTRTRGGFSPALSEVGPGSLTWEAAKRHYFTRVQERVVVPLGGGRAVAIAPYIGYRGFPVRHPYWRAVYVYHQGGTIEDLTPQEAMRRPELARSGRLFPEKLARRIADAYGYGPSGTEIDDPRGNPQPYLTNLGDGQIRWVTVGHPRGDDSTVATIFLTDAAGGRTLVWHAPPGRRLLSNEGAAQLTRTLDIEWNNCCDSDGTSTPLRFVSEPRPVFARGRFFYVVSILPEKALKTPEAVDRTVVIDAQKRRIVKVVDHADSDADEDLRAFFAGEAR